MHTFHYVARALRGTLLACDHRELLELWRRFSAAFPLLLALCVMPDHVHLLLPGPVDAEVVRRVMRGFARWLNARRGGSGPVWRPLGAPSVREGAAKRRTDVRYIHLNPCRARFVSDPLCWPASTHYDATGLALWPARRAEPDADSFHSYVSADPTVHVQGTLLPTRGLREPSLDQVLAAVTSLGRVTAEELAHRSPERSLLLRAARTLTSATNQEIAAFAGVGQTSVKRAPRLLDARIARVAAAAGDRRFSLLTEQPVAAWERYRQWRAGLPD
jgi:hypothetical protein